MSRSRAIGLLLLCIFLWSTGGFLIKSISWSPLATAGVRSGLCALILWFFYRPLVFRWDAPQFGAALANASTMILFVCATKLTTAANAVFLQYMAPVYVALFSGWYLREKIRASSWFSMLIALFGMYLFFKDSADFSHNVGNVLACISAVTFAWTVLFLRKHDGRSMMESIILANALAFVVCSPWVIREVALDQNLVYAILIAIFQMTLPNVLYVKVIKNLPAFDVMCIGLLEPIMNPTLVFLVHGEQPTQIAMLGGACIVSVVFFQFKKPAS